MYEDHASTSVSYTEEGHNSTQSADMNFTLVFAFLCLLNLHTVQKVNVGRKRLMPIIKLYCRMLCRKFLNGSLFALRGKSGT